MGQKNGVVNTRVGHDALGRTGEHAAIRSACAMRMRQGRSFVGVIQDKSKTDGWFVDLEASRLDERQARR